MNIFGVPEAKHYCSKFGGATGPAAGSTFNYLSTQLNGVTTLKEGTKSFDDYRDCSLREAERCLFLAISLYRRSFDHMISSAASWAHVTVYYGSFYSASALLRMFGGLVRNRTIIDVSASSPGNQELVIKRRVPSTYTGPHQRFWDSFYSAANTLVPWVDPLLRFGITPVSSSRTWQIENRNKINYDTFEACRLMSTFRSTFRKTKFRATLPGVLNTQFFLFEAMLLITCDFVREFGMKTDALNTFGISGARYSKIRELIFEEKMPILNRAIKRRRIMI